MAPVHILYVLEATDGGTRRHLRDLVCGLPSGFSATVVVSTLRDPAFAREDRPVYQEAGARWIELPMRRSAGAGDFMAVRRLRKLLHSLRPDIVHAHSSKAGAVARLASRGDFPVVYTPHGFSLLMPGFVWPYRLFETFAVRWTDAVICVTEEEARLAQSLGYADGRIHVIRNGITPPVPPSCVSAAREGIGFFGRDVPQKGADVLRACKGLPVRFFTHYPQGEAIALMRTVAVAAMPSRWEGCPYALLEAWAAGTPVVASAVGGLKELIRHGENGWLLPPDATPGEWERKLGNVLRDPSLRERVAEGGRRSFAAHMLSGMLEKTLSVYRAVLGKTGGPCRAREG